MNADAVIKIYDKSDNFLQELPFYDDYVITKTLNAGMGQLRISMPIRNNEPNVGVVIALMNRLEVVRSSPTGVSTTIYSGFINSYRHAFNQGSLELEVEALAYTTLLSKVLYRSSTDVTISHTTTAGEDIFTDIIDKYLGIHPDSPLNYTTNSIATGANSITEVYQTTTCQDALRRTIGRMGSDWYWKSGADNLITLFQKPSTPTHVFTIGRDISDLKIETSLDDVVNAVNFWDQASLSQYYYSDTYLSDYWRRMESVTDSAVSGAATAQQIAERIVDGRELPNTEVIVKIPVGGGFPISDIDVGDTFGIAGTNIGIESDANILITNLRISKNFIEVIGGDIRKLTSNILSELRENLLRDQFNPGQPNYTAVAI